MQNPIVIVGAGQAGAQAVISLRQAGYDGDLVLLGNEAFAPYQRPPLSKAYLMGKMTNEQLLLRPATFWDSIDVDLRLSCAVDKIDVAGKSLLLSGGDRLAYSKLLLTTGTRSRGLPFIDESHDRVHSLRGIDDVNALKGKYEEGSHLAIIGAGYIGLEVAAALRSNGCKISVIEAQERVLQRVVSEQISEFYQNLHREHAVDLHLGKGLSCVETGEDGVQIELADGGQIEADGVLVAIGAIPNTELAEAAGFDIENGIKVDQACETSVADHFAAGDCASFYSDRYARSIRLESVQNAIDQAKAAASAMLGETVHYDPVPWFWSDQYDVKLQIAGLSQGYDRTEISGSVEEKKFAVSYYAGDTLLAVDAVNSARDHMMARRALS